MYELRYYQKQAIESIYNYARTHKESNPVAVLPTGAGKTLVLAQLCLDTTQQWHQRVCLVTHQKELLQQAKEKLLASGIDDVGIFCAGLGEKDLTRAVTLASIQSIVNHVKDLNDAGIVSLIIVDEAHRIPANSEGQYGEFFEAQQSFNPNTRIIGLTATPYRMTSGMIFGEGRLFDDVCYEIPVGQLIADGYLSRIRPFGSKNAPQTERLHIVRGDFDKRETEEMFDNAQTVRMAVQDILEKTKDRRRILIFCCSIKHAEDVAKELSIHAPFHRKDKVVCRYVHSNMPSEERDEILAEFRGKQSLLADDDAAIYLTNVDVLTTGFDAPNIDAVILLRPTQSPGLYVQMVGRGLRKCEGKEDCILLDYGGNVRRHGPIDSVTSLDRGKEPAKRTTRECTECHAIYGAHMDACPECGHRPEKQEREYNHGMTADDADPLSKNGFDLIVRDWHFVVHQPREGKVHPTVRVRYITDEGEYDKYLCPEHTDSPFALHKFHVWWRDHGTGAPPTDCETVASLGNHGAYLVPQVITVKRRAGTKFFDVEESQLDTDFIPANSLMPRCHQCVFFSEQTSLTCTLKKEQMGKFHHACRHFADTEELPF